MTHRKFFAYRSFWPELETIKKFGEIGINTIVLFPSNTANSLGEPYSKYPPNWLWFDNYDFSPVDQQIADILEVNPNAEFLAMLDLNSPLWLQRQVWTDNADSFSNLTEALCAPRWREATTNYLKAITAHLEENYGDRIVSYILACGSTDEWLDLSLGADSPAKYAAYAEYCRKNNWSVPADIPPYSQREHVSFDGLLRDPEVDQEALRYWRFTSDVVVDGILYFIKELRLIIRPEVEVGIFYGYILELTIRNLVQCGHLAYERLLADDSLDFLISPGTYRHRRIGEGGGFMIPDGTIRRFGKNYMHECDQRTHCFNPNLTDIVKLEFLHWENIAEDIAGMRREMALSLIKHTSLWWFDMWGGYYQGKEIYDNLRTMRELWETYSGNDDESLAEVAMVVDPQSIFYLDDSNEKVLDIHPEVRNALNGLGAPFDVLSLADISEIADFKRYKLLIFPSLYEVTPEKKALLEKYVWNGDRTIIWFYGVGLSDGKTMDAERMVSLTGVAFDSEGVMCQKMQGWNSVYVKNYDAAKPALFKELAEDAGVLLWQDTEEPVFANRKLACFHTAQGGTRKISFPKEVSKVTELYTGKKYELSQGSLEYTFAKPDTALFELEWICE